MATSKQKQAARKNIKKAQETWKNMSHTQRARSQPQGKQRAKAGTGSGSKFYHIEVRSPREFVTFRTHDVGEKGHLERRAGKRSSGSWSTVSWLINKDDAHVEDSKLLIDRKEIKNSLRIRGPITHRKGNIFQAKPRKNIPEKDKPTAAQQRARKQNIKKAQAARHA